MRIAELFYSIQGEGSLLGVPSVFIRTSGCNLRCHWCDTPYTSWEPEGEEMPLDHIARYVRAHSRGHVVLTGGEPMLAPDVVSLTRELSSLGQHITIETAGTVYAPVVCNLMSLSPKLANSTPWEREGGRRAEAHEHLRLQPGVLRRLMEDYEYQLKFVVASPSDLEELNSLVASLGAEPSRVWLMPEGVDRDELAERSAWLVDIAKREGYRFTPRLHIDLFGHRRGV